MIAAASPRAAVKHHNALIFRIEQLMMRKHRTPEHGALQIYRDLLAHDCLTDAGERHVETIVSIMES